MLEFFGSVVVAAKAAAALGRLGAAPFEKRLRSEHRKVSLRSMIMLNHIFPPCLQFVSINQASLVLMGSPHLALIYLFKEPYGG